MGALRQTNITDRALRYRANRAIPNHARVCAFCGAKKVEVGHVDGHEENDSPENLTWTCRPCNVVAGNVLRNAGLGRKTRQFNPSKSGGASSVGEWIQAVGAITPHIDRGDRGLASAMSVSAAVDMIRNTPHSRRSQFAAALNKHRSGRRAANPFGGLFGARETIHGRGGARYGSVKEAKAAERAAERESLASQKRQLQREYQGLKLEAQREKLAALKAKRAGEKGVTIPVLPSQAAIQKAYERGASSLREAVEMAGGKINPAFFGRKRKNPATGAAEAYEDFHGHPSTELVTVKQKVHHHKDLAAAGDLRALSIKPVNRLKPVRTMKGFGKALLCFNEKRNQLFIRGGNQKMDAAELKSWGITSPHEVETIGKVLNIDYFTTKDHLGDEGGTAVYGHKFRTTNENGQHVTVTIARYPDLIYRVLDEQLEFSGGSYTIRREGIDL